MTEKPCFGCGKLQVFEEGKEQLCPSCLSAKNVGGKERINVYLTPRNDWVSKVMQLGAYAIGLSMFVPFIVMVLSVV